MNKLKGVHSTMVGYAGGVTENPSYDEVCTGQTNHNEVCRFVYDPAELSFLEILTIFWMRHDSTTLNGQGNDRGTQYRSEIWYFDESQRNLAEQTKERYQKLLDEKYGEGTRMVSTLISDGNASGNQFFLGEDYHQQYDAKPGNRQYCGLRPLKINDHDVRTAFQDL